MSSGIFLSSSIPQLVSPGLSSPTNLRLDIQSCSIPTFSFALSSSSSGAGVRYDPGICNDADIPDGPGSTDGPCSNDGPGAKEDIGSKDDPESTNAPFRFFNGNAEDLSVLSSLGASGELVFELSSASSNIGLFIGMRIVGIGRLPNIGLLGLGSTSSWG